MRDKKGITLVALIITVIVMLILAGVAIGLTIGDNGIFKKSKEGAKIYQNSTNNETNNLKEVEKEMGDLMNQYQEETTPNPTPIPGKPDEKGIYTENSTINGGEAEAFNPEIPKGFKPVNVDTAKWGNGSSAPSKEAVKAGLVIEDEEGNQFVWIAVDGTEVTLQRYIFTQTGEIDTTLSKTEPLDELKESSSTNIYIEGLKGDNTPNAKAKDIVAFRNSVAEHGGYYIARYEASYGVDRKPNSKISTGNPITANGESNEPKVEGMLWNNISQTNAANVCGNMYDSSYGITSDLMNAYAWDTAIAFIQKYSGDSRYSLQTSLNSTLKNTGTIGDEKCHIHDMASNCMEWTTELTNIGPCVYRGGIYNDNSSICTKSRYGNSTTAAGNGASFRPILYL